MYSWEGSRKGSSVFQAVALLFYSTLLFNAFCDWVPDDTKQAEVNT